MTGGRSRGYNVGVQLFLKFLRDVPERIPELKKFLPT